MARVSVISVMLSLLAARSNSNYPVRGREFQILRHNVNRVEMCVSNYGKFGQDDTYGYFIGCWWPIGTDHNYIYGAGTWFGTVDALGDSLVTVGYCPRSGFSEYAPGRTGWPVNDPQAILYMYPEIWPPYDPTRLPMAPTMPKSHQDSWCVYNDADIGYHIAGDTRPIGLEVYQSVYAWNLSTARDVIFLRFEVKNVTNSVLSECYVGICTDNDIGNEAGIAANDRISGIVGQWYVIDGDSTYIDDLGYQWQEVEEPGTPPWFPGAIGFDYLQSPWDLVQGEDKDGDGIPDEFERDSVYFANNVPPAQWDVDLDGTPDWRDPSEIPQLGMTAFKRFTSALEPSFDIERYMTLAGYNFRTGVYEPYDTVPPDPDDQRFLQCSGPFELEPDSAAIVLVGIMFAEWNGIFLRPDSALVEVDGTAQFIFDQNWLLPGPPPPPNLTLLPGDKLITLVWDNIAETTPDPYYDVVGTNPASPMYDPYYLQFDFEGYRVWKSITGQPGSWELLTTCDLANNITIIDSTMQLEPLITPNTGIFHLLTDEAVRNGFPYYYAVTAFDYNYVKTQDSLGIYPTAIWFESGLSGDSARPRRDPANYVGPGEPLVEYLSGNDQIAELVTASVAYPQEIDPNYPLYIEYLGPDTATAFYMNENNNQIPYTGARYTALLKDDVGILDTISYVVTIGAGYVPHEVVPPENGMFINSDIGAPELPAAFVVYDSIEIVSGTYPYDFLVMNVPVPLPAAEDSADTVYMHGMWAWRGNPYEIVWQPKHAGSPVNTVTITDLVTGEYIPYRQFQNTPSTRHLGAGWCFTWHTPSTVWIKASHDTLQVGFQIPANNTRYLYLNGGMIALRNNSSLYDTILPSDGETWIVYPNRDYLPPSIFGEVRITGTPGVFSDSAMTLNVK
ncbi:MAG: hypothetical protein PVH23_07215, partial [candidate division WOR-3 bacterium]